MTPGFADTYFFLAIANPADPPHRATREVSVRDPSPLVTTVSVLTELADAMAAPVNRATFLRLWGRLKHNPTLEVLDPDADLWSRGLDLYARRPDNCWSLTDCISFVVMTDRRHAEALTGDHHLEQAGFRALLREA